MSNSLRLLCIGFSLFIIIAILLLNKKRKISIKYSIIWLILFSLFFVCTIYPKLLVKITNILGFVTASNMIFAILIGILIMITIMLTVIVSELNVKIRILVQEISILEEEKKKK